MKVILLGFGLGEFVRDFSRAFPLKAGVWVLAETITCCALVDSADSGLHLWMQLRAVWLCSDLSAFLFIGCGGASMRRAAMDLRGRVCFSQRRAVLPLQGSLGPAFGHQDLGASQVRRWVASLTSGAQLLSLTSIPSSQWQDEISQNSRAPRSTDCIVPRDQPAW